MILQNDVSLGLTEHDVNLSTHRQIIIAIHENWLNADPFALRDVAAKAGVSISSVTRTLRLLKTIKLLIYTKKAWAGRHYRVSNAWPGTAAQAIQLFEYAKIVKV